MDLESYLPPTWRRAFRTAVTLVLIALYAAVAAPTVATMLLALRANGVTAELPLAVLLAPLSIVLAGPGVFVLGLVFGWMLLGLARLGTNGVAARVGLAVLVATVAWWLHEPLPGAVAASSGFGDWLVWAASAAAAALIFTRGWVAHRIAFADRED
ncbi:MAG: hypothetical protein IT555_06270 [Acetobacteraceae bacterium]|nr:hypothetical protein [Acetobacteraceae bacterium]